MASDRLGAAFRDLTTCTRPRYGQTEDDLRDGARRIFRVLTEYPEEVALAAIDAWPRRSETFPTEKELRDLLDDMSAERSRQLAAAQPSAGKGVYHTPVGRTANFVDDVRLSHGAAFAKSWLAGGINCLFSDTQILTTGFGAETLRRECDALLRKHDVSVRQHERARELLDAYCQTLMTDADFTPKKRRRS
jgi:hypothetical protein